LSQIKEEFVCFLPQFFVGLNYKKIMTEKIGTIKNPLTIIAIFAGIAEVSGTLVLPFIANENQLLFIYFLIVFPSILIILFFITLNFNNKALYAPSDFKNEEHYIQIFKYDESKQARVQVSVTREQMVEILNENLMDFKRSNDIKVQKLEHEIIKLKTIKNETIEIYEDDGLDEDDYMGDNTVSILNLPNAEKLINLFSSKGYPTELNEPHNTYNEIDFEYHKSIWLGSEISFEKAKEVILTAKDFYPHLEYIKVSDKTRDIPEFVHYQIFIGGSTQVAVEEGAKQLKKEDWEKVKSAENLEELYKLL